MKHIAATLLILASCREPATPDTEATVAKYPPVSAADAYFPLEAGHLYHYVTDENGEPGMMVANVARADATHGELHIGSNVKRFALDAKGIAYEGGAYVLQVPLDVGTSWPGEHGGTTKIVSNDAPITVPAGTYGNCIETVEDVVPEAHYRNTYCPGVGLVLLEVTSPRGHARVELKRYGEPVKL
jgi:hypothetical protein